MTSKMQCLKCKIWYEGITKSDQAPWFSIRAPKRGLTWLHLRHSDHRDLWQGMATPPNTMPFSQMLVALTGITNHNSNNITITAHYTLTSGQTGFWFSIWAPKRGLMWLHLRHSDHRDLWQGMAAIPNTMPFSQMLVVLTGISNHNSNNITITAHYTLTSGQTGF